MEMITSQAMYFDLTRRFQAVVTIRIESISNQEYEPKKQLAFVLLDSSGFVDATAKNANFSLSGDTITVNHWKCGDVMSRTCTQWRCNYAVATGCICHSRDGSFYHDNHFKRSRDTHKQPVKHSHRGKPVERKGDTLLFLNEMTNNACGVVKPIND